jgi:hypothetical protein
MVVTVSGILATGWRAHAQEPSRDGSAPPPDDPARVAPFAVDGGAPQPSETPAPPAVETKPTSPALPGVAERAEATAEVPGPAAPAAAETEGKGKKKKKKDKDRDETAPGLEQLRFGSFELKGRVLVRSEFDRRDTIVLERSPDGEGLISVPRTVDSLDLSVPSARFSLHYTAPAEWLTAVGELDIAGRPDMKDAYVQARNSRFIVRAGQFKVPVSAMEATSPWALPVVRRGLLNDVLVGRMDYGGRRPGVIFGFRGRDLDWHPRLTVGAFQGSYLAADPTPRDRDTDLLNAMKFPGQSFVARAEVEILSADVGAYYENRIGSPALNQTYRYWTAGADLYYDRVFYDGGFRFWLEGMYGTSWYEHESKVPDGKDAMYAAARTMVAYRFGGTTEQAFYVEPYALGALLDPDTQVTSDHLWEGVIGVNVGYWRRARLSLQGEINKGQRNFPTGYFVGPPPNRQAVILQAGVAF